MRAGCRAASGCLASGGCVALDRGAASDRRVATAAACSEGTAAMQLRTVALSPCRPLALSPCRSVALSACRSVALCRTAALQSRHHAFAFARHPRAGGDPETSASCRGEALAPRLRGDDGIGGCDASVLPTDLVAARHQRFTWARFKHRPFGHNPSSERALLHRGKPASRSRTTNPPQRHHPKKKKGPARSGALETVRCDSARHCPHGQRRIKPPEPLRTPARPSVPGSADS